MGEPLDIRSMFPFEHDGERPEFMKYTLGGGKPLKVINIGAGYTGLIASIRIPRRFPNIEFKTYEKNHDVGGTWLENTYPGVACDIPSHAYQATFETNPDWTQYYSSGAEIWKYFKHLAVKYDAEKYITFNTKMTEARWQEDKRMWKVSLQNTKTGETFEEECNVLIGCYGILNRPRMADIPGRDTFKGKLVHPARWDHSIDLKGKSVAVIGNGSSALQIIPAIYEQVESLDNYVRSRTWLTSGFGGDLVPVDGVHETRGSGGVNFSYTQADKDKFRQDREYYGKYERALRDAIACLHLITFKGSPLATGAQKATAELMRSKSTKKPEIAEAIIPEWTIGCRRLTPGTDYIVALCEEKCQMIKEPIERFDEKGIVTTEGKSREYDVIILCSGYDLSFNVCPIYGRNGVNLTDLYEEAPESYLGLCPPEMPNYFVPAGPNGIVTTGTFLPVLEFTITYVMSFLSKLQRERIDSMTPKRSAVRAYSRQCERYFKQTVYTDQCRTWMRGCKSDPDRIVAIYPGSYLHFRTIYSNPRWEDFDIELMDEEEPFTFFGNGMVEQDMDMKGNFAPYMSIEEEYPELREFFAKEKKEVTKAAVNGDSGEAKVEVEKDGSLSVGNAVVEHVPVTA